ncbi:hypothetical protein HDV01_000366 [Terramyces sp. JEL0728]|nr:hypothetical protein HDV01_000366 [Terramyces sp. JEL0728]
MKYSYLLGIAAAFGPNPTTTNPHVQTTVKPVTTAKPATTANPVTTARPVTTAGPVTTAKPITTTGLPTHNVPSVTTSVVAPTNEVVLNWNIGWVSNRNPDGLYPRDVIGINGQWPIPPIYANIGDTLVINTVNSLNETSSIHFHGIFQNGTAYYDGALGITDCGIPANGGSFTYRVALNQYGTYWVHSHHAGQYPDGFRTPLVIRAPQDKIDYQYDAEYTLGMSDWYYEKYNILYANFTFPKGNPAGLEPIPNSIVLNDAPNQVFDFQAGKTYRLRLISMSTFAAINFWIDGHTMQVIETDGVPTNPYTTNVLSLGSAQRYSVLVTANANSKYNYNLNYQLDQGMFAAETLPAQFSPNATALIRYGTANPLAPADPVPDPSAFNDMEITPKYAMPALKADQIVRWDAMFAQFSDYVNHGAFNYTVYEFPLVPALFTALSTGNNATNLATYGKYAHTQILDYMKNIQIILVNTDTEGGHPFHLHGHTFQVLGRGDLAVVDGESIPIKYGFDYSVLPPLDSVTNPLRRDTIVVPKNSYAILRFTADNPGVWFFHCHIQWHVQAGLAAQFIEAPLQMQQNIKVPSDVYQQCAAQGIKTAGNAAGFFDTTTFTGLTKSPFIVGS